MIEAFDRLLNLIGIQTLIDAISLSEIVEQTMLDVLQRLFEEKWICLRGVTSQNSSQRNISDGIAEYQNK